MTAPDESRAPDTNAVLSKLPAVFEAIAATMEALDDEGGERDYSELFADGAVVDAAAAAILSAAMLANTAGVSVEQVRAMADLFLFNPPGFTDAPAEG